MTQPKKHGHRLTLAICVAIALAIVFALLAPHPDAKTEIGGIIYNPPQMRRAGYTFQIPSYLPDADHAYLVIGKNKDGKTGWVKLNWE